VRSEELKGGGPCYVLRVTCYVLRVTCYVLRVTCYELQREGAQGSAEQHGGGGGTSDAEGNLSCKSET